MVVVGAPGEDTGATNAGRAYVHDLSSGTPAVPVVTLNHSSPAPNDNFGGRVAISGPRVVVGTAGGSAYVYDLGSGTPAVPVFTLNNPSPALNDRFGSSVAISGTRVVVGAYQDDAGAINAGRAYVYDLGKVTPTVPIATLSSPSPTQSGHFGIAVAIAGTQVVVGAQRDRPGASNTGIAYVYDFGQATPTVPVFTLHNPNPAAHLFGNGVAISGTRLLVRASLFDSGATDATLSVYDLSSGTPTVPVAALRNPIPSVKITLAVQWPFPARRSQSEPREAAPWKP